MRTDAASSISFREYDSLGRCRAPRHVNGEDASVPGQGPRVDPAMVRFYAAEREAEPKTRPIGTSLL
jgi:hypothetical protein